MIVALVVVALIVCVVALVDGLHWAVPTGVFGHAGDVRRFSVPRDLGPVGALLVLDRLALRAVVAVSSGK